MEEWLKKDPIDGFKRDLLGQGLALESELEEIDGAVMREIEEAARFAASSPFPEPSALYQDVYEE